MSEHSFRTPTGRALLALGFFGVLVAISPIALAQSSEVSEPPPGPIVTDRPTNSISAMLVSPRTFQLEAGYLFNRNTTNSDSIDVQVLPDLLARYGIKRKAGLPGIAGFP